VANRCVEFAGPPPVSAYTSWKSAKVWMTENSVTTIVTGKTSGHVIRQNRCQPLAPSIAAAS